ncbi:E3 ubiquitin-protein ligase RNF149 isoform X2 [Choloepus didactylus]|uniref:E3 ubiquitin-protein ligase RNF149 isoform X2 n=1 Tax=Choloepus didactylus TaxID=27675 RepID=UPI00189F7289|nr:E3 ubiquitin-protein ligase RNF149 isoform X2 [Choloepus didactylus]
MAWQRRPDARVWARGALALLAVALCAPGARGGALEWYSALVSTAYVDPQTNRTVRSVSEDGRFSDSSPKEGAQGLVGVPRGPDAEACAPDTRFHVPAPGGRGAVPWVALVARGGCPFKDKVAVAARRNASAVVVYNEERYGNLTAPISHAGTGNTVVIMVSYPKGREILDLVQKGIPVRMAIGLGTRHVQEFISGQSVVFVAIAFITMMIISLAWLIFYYIQRFLYTGSQFGNQGIDIDAENCAVCIENFKVKDIIRILPCKHIFHRTCIDPWLLDHRTCPMCKLDVIKALGYWGEPEDVQEMPAPESPPGSVPAVNLSSSVQDDDRSDRNNLPSSSSNESVPQRNAGFKEDTAESIALLGTGGSDPQRGGPVA